MKGEFKTCDLLWVSAEWACIFSYALVSTPVQLQFSSPGCFLLVEVSKVGSKDFVVTGPCILAFLWEGSSLLFTFMWAQASGRDSLSNAGGAAVGHQ